MLKIFAILFVVSLIMMISNPAEGFAGLIVSGIFLFMCIKSEIKFSIKDPKDIDTSKMREDIGKDAWVIRENYGNGKYDKDNKDREI